MSMVGIYARLSVDDKSSLSCQNQIEQLREFCFLKNLGQVKEYIDDGYSGKNMERPALKSLITDIENGTINTLLVKDLSRFSRNLLDAMYFIEEFFKKYKTRFISVNDNYDSFLENDEYEVVIRCFINEYYIKDCSKKIKSVIANKANRQSLSTGFYGYVLDENKKLVIHPERAEIVRYIYDEYIAGKNINSIVSALNEKKIPSPRAIRSHKEVQWTNQSIHSIVANEEYTGVAINYKNVSINFKELKNKDTVRIENDHEPIISKEIFTLAEARRNKTILATQKKHDIEKLCGRVYCLNCNRSMIFSYEKKGNNFLYQTYTCPICKNKIKAKNLYSILEEDIKKVTNRVKENSSDKLLKKRMGSILENKLVLDKEMKDIQLSYKFIFESYMLGKITQESYLSQIESLKQKEKNLNEVISKNLQVQKSEEQVLSEYKIFLKNIKRFTNFTQVEYIKQFIEKVQIKDNYLNISYKYHF